MSQLDTIYRCPKCGEQFSDCAPEHPYEGYFIPTPTMAELGGYIEEYGVEFDLHSWVFRSPDCERAIYCKKCGYMTLDYDEFIIEKGTRFVHILQYGEEIAELADGKQIAPEIAAVLFVMCSLLALWLILKYVGVIP